MTDGHRSLTWLMHTSLCKHSGKDLNVHLRVNIFIAFCLNKEDANAC